MESDRIDPERDVELRETLLEWKVEGAPQSVDRRVRGLRRPWFGSLLIPVPVAAAFVLVLIAMGIALLRERAVPAAKSAGADVSLADFRPNNDVHVRIIEGRP